MVTIWGLRGHQKSQAKDRDTGNIGQVESWRRSLSRKRWRWIPSATMRCFVKSRSFPVVFLGMFFLQHESKMLGWIFPTAVKGSSVEAPRGWIGRSLGQAVFWNFVQSQKSDVLLCYAFLLIKSFFFGLWIWIFDEFQVTEPREPGSSGPFEGVPVSPGLKCLTKVMLKVKHVNKMYTNILRSLTWIWGKSSSRERRFRVSYGTFQTLRCFGIFCQELQNLGQQIREVWNLRPLFLFWHIFTFFAEQFACWRQWPLSASRKHRSWRCARARCIEGWHAMKIWFEFSSIHQLIIM